MLAKSAISHVLHSTRLAVFRDQWDVLCLRRDSLSCLHNTQLTVVEHVYHNPSKKLNKLYQKLNKNKLNNLYQDTAEPLTYSEEVKDKFQNQGILSNS